MIQGTKDSAILPDLGISRTECQHHGKKFRFQVGPQPTKDGGKVGPRNLE